VHHAGAAVANATAKFGAKQSQRVAQNPEQGRVGCYIDLMCHTVDVECIVSHETTPLPAKKAPAKRHRSEFAGTVLWQLPGVRETRTYAVMEEVKNSVALALL
jgi:hypothetical protein